MKRSADVRSIDALKEAKIALIEFREAAALALMEAHAEVQRTLWWVQNSQRLHWQTQVKKRAEKVAQAKSELQRAQLSTFDSQATLIDFKKRVQRAEAALHEAERKVLLVRKWAQMLEREFLLYKGQCQAMARIVDGHIPKGEARIEKLLQKLERYFQLRAPQTGDPRPARSDLEESTDTTETQTPSKEQKKNA